MLPLNPTIQWITVRSVGCHSSMAMKSRQFDSKLETVKTISTPRKINASLQNITINRPKLARIRGYKLATKWRNTTEIYLTRVQILQKVWGRGLFLTHTVYRLHQCLQHLNLTPLASWQFSAHVLSTSRSFFSWRRLLHRLRQTPRENTLTRTNPARRRPRSVRRRWNYKHRVMILDVGRGSGRPQ